MFGRDGIGIRSKFTVTLSSISLSSSQCHQGRSLQGTVTLNMAAPGDGIAVSLAADPAGAAMVPASVKVPRGQPVRPSR